MAKPTKTNGSFTVYSLRRMAGIPSRRPSRFNACVAAALRGKTYSAPPGEGGRHNVQVHNAFAAAAKSCGTGRRASKKKK